MKENVEEITDIPVICLDTTINKDILNAPITGEEITKAVSGLKNGKSNGIDGIKNEHMKHSVEVLMPLYLFILNKALDKGTIPDEWGTGLIVPIFKKKGDITDPSNYRGITLLSCLGKLFTSIINSRLTQFIEDNKILNENQAGFRKGYSTVDQIFVLKSLIDIMCYKKKDILCIHRLCKSI